MADAVLTPASSPDFLAENRMLAQFMQFSTSPAFRRALPTIVAVGVTMLALGAYLFMQSPARTTLYASLPEAEKARVLEALQNAGIDVGLDPTTGDIMVPTDAYHASRMTLAAQGLPATIPQGYDALDGLQMGASRSVEAMRLKQAQELELARSIAEIEHVLAARVHLALPEKEVFIRDDASPSASVFVQLAQGRSLGGSQVEAILHLVSSSVPKLAEEDVSIIDQNGSLLSSASRNHVSRVKDTELEHRVRMEEIYRQRILSLLTPIVGPGNVSAQVNLDIDFTRSEITEEVVDPEGNALRSEQNTQDITRETQAKGIPGAVANTPPQTPDLSLTNQTTGTSSENIRSRSSSEVKNYEVSRIISNTQKPSHRVQKINAAVLVRDEMRLDPETGTQTPIPLSEARKVQIEALVIDAIGIDINRGDSLTVSSSPFIDNLEGVRLAWYEHAWLRGTLNQFAIVLILAIIILGLIRPLLSRILIPAAASNSQASNAGEEEFDLDQIEVNEGESLEDIKAKLKPKKQAISPEMLDTANTYDDKVAIIRMIVADEAGRVSNVFKSMMQKDIDARS